MLTRARTEAKPDRLGSDRPADTDWQTSARSLRLNSYHDLSDIIENADFLRFGPELLGSALEVSVAESGNERAKFLERDLASGTYESVVLGFEAVVLPLCELKSWIELKGIFDNRDDFRAASAEIYAAAEKKLFELLGDDEPYQILVDFEKNSANGLTAGERRNLRHWIDSCQSAGAGLDSSSKTKLAAAAHEEAVHSRLFLDNCAKAGQQVVLHLKPGELSNDDLHAGFNLGQAFFTEAAKRANKLGLTGHAFSVGPGPYGSFMASVAKQDLTARMLTTYYTQTASGRFDNTDHALRILRSRDCQAKLIDGPNGSHGNRAVRHEMVSDPKVIAMVLESMGEKFKALDAALIKKFKAHRAELAAALEATPAIKMAADGPFLHSERIFYRKSLAERELSAALKEARSYFKLENVLNFMFEKWLAPFGFELRPVTDGPPLPEGLLRYEVHDHAHPDEAPKRQVIINPCYRSPNYRDYTSSAIRPRGTSGQAARSDTILIYLSPSTLQGDESVLLGNYDLRHVAHEIGHLLAYLKDKRRGYWQQEANGPKDKAELCAYFFETFLTDPNMLRAMSRHHKTEAVIPEDVLATMVISMKLEAIAFWTSQSSLAALDHALHNYLGPAQAQDIRKFSIEIMQPFFSTELLPDYAVVLLFDKIGKGEYAGKYCGAYILGPILGNALYDAVLGQDGIDAEGSIRAKVVAGIGAFLSGHPHLDNLAAFKELIGSDPQNPATLKRLVTNFADKFSLP